jgi:forkhead protein FKH
MPPSARRSSQRARKARDPSPSPVHEQSSPSRPAKRRRKVNASAAAYHLSDATDDASPKAQPDPPSEPVEEEESSLTIDAAANPDEALISQVTQCLASIPTQAGKDHANSLQEQVEGIPAYAKIAAQEWTYYVKNLVVNIGRSTEQTHGHPPPTDPEDKDFVHIDLGPNKVFSRQTAIIYFDAEADPDADHGSWFLQVKGRNGLKVNGELIKREDEPHLLSSGDVVEVGGIEMMFVLPGNIGPLHIHEMFTSRVGHGPPQPNRAQRSSPPTDSRTSLPLPVPEPAAQKNASRTPAAAAAAAASQGQGQGQGFQQPIAPAPPDYKRPGTPPSAARGGRANVSQHKSPAYGSSGTMLMNPNDVDLSLDENKHIKPLFSYAQMITQAILSTPDHKLNLNGIYRYIMDKYAYYKSQPPSGWQVSFPQAYLRCLLTC